MMKGSIVVFQPQRWISSDTPAANHYELLERPLFDLQLDEILQDIRLATRALLPYQNHNDPEVARRTVHVQYELARAAATFTDSAKLQAYHVALIRNLRDAFLAGRSPKAQTADKVEVCQWLTARKVDPRCRAIVGQAIVSHEIEKAVAALDQKIVVESLIIQREDSEKPRTRVFNKSPGPTGRRTPTASPRDSPAPKSHADWKLDGLFDELAEELPVLGHSCPQCLTGLPHGSEFCALCGWSKSQSGVPARPFSTGQLADPRPRNDPSENSDQRIRNRFPDVAIYWGALAVFLAVLGAGAGYLVLVFGHPMISLVPFAFAGIPLSLYTVSVSQLLANREIILVDVQGSWEARLLSGVLIGYWVDTERGKLSCFDRVYKQLRRNQPYCVAVTRCWACFHIYAVIRECSYAQMASQETRKGRLL